MENNTDYEVNIPIHKHLTISYNLPGKSEILTEELLKDDSKEYETKLREIEDYLANSKATNIVYTLSDSYE